METYGVCLDEAMDGRYTAEFMAALAAQLPQDCRWKVAADGDAWWTGDRMLLANVANVLAMYVWGMSDRKKRGRPPKLLGPSWAVEHRQTRSLAAEPMGKDELLRELAKPRHARRGG